MKKILLMAFVAFVMLFTACKSTQVAGSDIGIEKSNEIEKTENKGTESKEKETKDTGTKDTEVVEKGNIQKNEEEKDIKIDTAKIYNIAFYKNDEKIEKSLFGELVTIVADVNTSLVKDGTVVKVKLVETVADKELGDFTGLDMETVTVENGKIKLDWKVNVTKELESGEDYVVPECKVLMYLNDEVFSSENMKIYSFVNTVFSDSTTHKALANLPYTIYYFPGDSEEDMKEIKGKTDSEGRVKLEWLPFGEYYITVGE